MFGILSSIIFFPTVAALALIAVPKAYARQFAYGASIISFALAVFLWRSFDPTSAAMQFTFEVPWIPLLGIHFGLGVDGISLPLVMLAAFIGPIAWLGTWPAAGSEPKNEKFFLANVLLLQTGMYGTFLSTDLFLFYFFWEVVLIPMFFLIGIWGGQNRVYATIKFFLYTLVGSLLMLVAIFWLVKATGLQLGAPSTRFVDIARLSLPFDAASAWTSPQTWLFLAFALAFVIKVPMVPFHTWLPDAHVQAPTIGSVFLAAVLLKMGTYGLIRICLPIFPEAAYWASPVLQALGVIGVLYGAFCAMAQDDFKKLVAYSSVSHMGYILVGLFAFEPIALSGSLYQMINHGISSAGLFLIVGFLYERLHTRNLNEFGALAKTVPLMAIAFMIMTLSSVALPGTNGFVGEFTILLGVFQMNPVMAGLCGLGVIFGAVYALKAYQKVMLGPSSTGVTPVTPMPGHGHDDHHGHGHADSHGSAGHGGDHGHALSDLNTNEIVAMGLLALFVFTVGFFPETFFGNSRVSLEALNQYLATRLGL